MGGASTPPALIKSSMVLALVPICRDDAMRQSLAATRKRRRPAPERLGRPRRARRRAEPVDVLPRIGHVEARLLEPAMQVEQNFAFHAIGHFNFVDKTDQQK